MEEDVARRYVELSEDWREELEYLFSYIGPRFGRVDRQQHAREYLLGLLSTVERKNGWQLAEAAEYATPYSLQHLERKLAERACHIYGRECAMDSETLSRPL